MQSRGKALAPIRRRATLDGMTRNDADEVGNNSLFPCPPRRVDCGCRGRCLLLGSKGKALALGELRGLMAKPSNHTELCIDETTQERMS